MNPSAFLKQTPTTTESFNTTVGEIEAREGTGMEDYECATQALKEILGCSDE